MFSLLELNRLRLLFSTYSATYVTPMQVMGRLRLRNKKKEISLLSDVFERMPGYSDIPILDFVQAVRLKTFVEDKRHGR